jgi:parvulin-like peptidyl-prolyl isomerase
MAGISGEEGRRARGTPPATPRQPSARTLSRHAREQFQQRLLIGVAIAIALTAVFVVGFGTLREMFIYPNEAVAYIGGDKIPLKEFKDTLQEEMRSLQSQAAAGSQNNPQAASSQVQKLIEAQEKLPEEVLEKEIENGLVRQEVQRRSINIGPPDVDAKINEIFSVQRDVLNQPTSTPTQTPTPRPTSTPTPEGWDPTATLTATPTQDPLTPSPTLDPLTPTMTRTPFPTRQTATPIVTPTIPPTMLPDEYQKAYQQLLPQMRSESRYRRGVELQVMRDKLKEVLGANIPTSGPAARVLRVATSTKDEATVARLQLVDFDYPFEEVLAQIGDRVVQGKRSADLGLVAKGAESKEFDEVVFNPATTLDTWTEPFQVGSHWEMVKVTERRDNVQYDRANLENMRERIYNEWLEQAKSSQAIERDLSAQERQWAVDRASKGIIETNTNPR